MPPPVRTVRTISADAPSPLILTDVICARIMLRLGDIEEWEAVAKAPCQVKTEHRLAAMPIEASLVKRLLHDFGTRSEIAEEIRASAELSHVRNWNDGY
jgi:hypothetical protein